VVLDGLVHGVDFSARRAGVEPSWLPGIRVPIAHFVAIDPPITMAELRAHGPSRSPQVEVGSGSPMVTLAPTICPSKLS
jgi:hypothetical protein